MQKNSKRTAPVRPDKRTMNFLRPSAIDRRKLLPALVTVIALLAAFAKVGFLDPLAQKAEAYNTLAAKQEQLAQINAELADYDALQQQYCRYSFGLMNETEINLVSRMDVLALVEAKIAGRATIEDFAVNNNVLTMNLCGITLREASAIVASLESSDLVTRATVNSAAADDGRDARIFISVTLTNDPQEAAE